MEVTHSGSDSLKIIIDGTTDLAGTLMGITLTCRGELMDFSTVKLESKPTEKILSLYGVPEGVCRLNLFDHDGNVLFYR